MGKLLGPVPEDRIHLCGYLATCTNPAIWHVAVPVDDSDLDPDGLYVFDPDEMTLLTACHEPEHWGYIEDNFPFRLVHEHDQDLCCREGTIFTEDGCVEELPSWRQPVEVERSQPASADNELADAVAR